MIRREFMRLASLALPAGSLLTGSELFGQIGLTGQSGRIGNFDRMPVYQQPDGISCGPTSASMVLKYYGRDAGIGPLKTACGTRMYSGPNFAGKQIQVGLTVPSGIKSGLESYGIPAVVRSGANLSEVMQYIDQSRPPILLVRSGWEFWHWIVVIGYYDDGARLMIHDPASGRRTIYSRDLQKGWDYSGTYEGKDIPNPRCNTCAGTGKISVPNPNLQCAVCSGSGKVKVKIGPFESGFGTCKVCGGSGRWKGEIPKNNCVVCGGRGHLPEGIRAFVGTVAPRNSLVVPSRGPAGGGQAAGGNPAGNVEIRYTILNDSGRRVNFQMQPSGKSYTLEAGRTFTGMSYQVNGKAPTITLSDSGRTYRLTPGNHKFWWMAKESRIGFDRSTD